MDEVLNAIKNVLNTLKYYEKDYTSAKRNPIDFQERAKSLSHYVECRLNFEFFKINELRKFEEDTDGHLFQVSSIIGENGRSFDRIIVSLNPLVKDVDKIFNWLGGNCIEFSSRSDELNFSVYVI